MTHNTLRSPYHWRTPVGWLVRKAVEEFIQRRKQGK
jgi:hypothetical protein